MSLSIHQSKARALAASKGAWAGTCPEDLWKLPRRELLEILLRVAASAAGDFDNPEAGLKEIKEEYEALIAAGIV